MVNISKTDISNCAVGCIVETTVLCCTWFSGMALSIISGIIFYRKGSRRTSGHRFLISMTFCNFFLMVGVVPMSIYVRFTNTPHGRFTGLLCQFAAFGFNAVVGVIMLTVLLIGLDRFLACVGNPLHHSRRMSYVRSLFLILASWCLPLAILLPLFFEGKPHISVSQSGYCDINWFDTAITKSVAVVYALITFFLPFIALAAIYVKVFISARNTGSSTRKNFVYEFQNHLGIRRSITVELAKSRSASETRLSSGRQSSYSSLQTFLNGHDNRKTVQIVIWILLSILICAFPFYLLMISTAFSVVDYSNESITLLHRLVFLLFFISSTILNPFLYIFSNSSLRRDVRRLFMGKAEIRRQCSLQINNGSFRSHSLLQVHKPDSRCISTRPSICLDLASGTPVHAYVSSAPVTTADSQLTMILPSESTTDTRLLMPNHSADNVMGKSSSSRSLSRKSVSFMEEDNPFVNRVAAPVPD